MDLSDLPPNAWVTPSGEVHLVNHRQEVHDDYAERVFYSTEMDLLKDGYVKVSNVGNAVYLSVYDLKDRKTKLLLQDILIANPTRKFSIRTEKWFGKDQYDKLPALELANMLNEEKIPSEMIVRSGYNLVDSLADYLKRRKFHVEVDPVCFIGGTAGIIASRSVVNLQYALKFLEQATRAIMGGDEEEFTRLTNEVGKMAEKGLVVWVSQEPNKIMLKQFDWQLRKAGIEIHQTGHRGGEAYFTLLGESEKGFSKVLKDASH